LTGRLARAGRNNDADTPIDCFTIVDTGKPLLRAVNAVLRRPGTSWLGVDVECVNHFSGTGALHGEWSG
jgi:hypothetical protein